jgi:CheY-like chemotaxis protein/anti-sigma regulatory factor (Ser/Thr protein kinase)
LGAPDAVAEGGSLAPSEAARGEAASWEQDTSRPAKPAGGTQGADILVVDDNADMRAYLTRLLGRHWSVRSTANGEEALSAVAERAPDIVLTDVMMPRVDGFELLRRLRADDATRYIPVIMLTARAGQEASVEGLEAGADDYLAKPFRADELIARVRVALERAAGRSAARTAERAASLPPAAVPVPGAVFAPAPPAREPADPRAACPTPRRHHEASPSAPGRHAAWRFPAEASSIPVLRRRLRTLLDDAEVEPDQAYDLLLAACEAATNAFEHAQDPTEPAFDVTVHVDDQQVRIAVRDYGQWRERTPSMDRGRGGTLMSAFGEITATPSPDGTTVTIVSSRDDDRSTSATA